MTKYNHSALLNTLSATTSGTDHGRSRLWLLLVLLPALQFASPADAGNPFSLDKTENSVTLSFKPEKLFQKAPKTKAPTPQPQAAASRSTGEQPEVAPTPQPIAPDDGRSELEKMAAAAGCPDAIESGARQIQVSVHPTTTAAPSANPLPKPVMASPTPPAAEVLPHDVPQRQAVPSESLLRQREAQMEQQWLEAQAQYERQLQRARAAQAQAYLQMLQYNQSVSSDLRAMGVSPY